MVELLVHGDLILYHSVVLTLGFHSAQVFATLSTRLHLSFGVHGVLELLFQLAFDNRSLEASLGHRFQIKRTTSVHLLEGELHLVKETQGSTSLFIHDVVN
jgi:hypothetical protein